MFDFQKEVILNNLNKVDNGTGWFRVDGMTYKTKYVKNVVKTEPVDGTPAKLTIDVGAIKTAVTTSDVQFVISLGLDRDYRADFTNATTYFGKPVVVTLKNESLTTDAIKAAFDKAAISGEKLYETSISSNTVVLTMTDNYITVRNAEVYMASCETSCSGESAVEWRPVGKGLTKVDNVAGFGTYEYLIHNHRLPTHANWRFASPAAVEMPIVGGKYTQYTFEYTVPRRIGGMSVAGQRNESTTIHTFYVLDGYNFENATGITLDGTIAAAAIDATHDKTHVATSDEEISTGSGE